MKPAAEILWSAAFALTPEENWTRGWLAKTRHGNWCKPNSNAAACWCITGACEAASCALGHSSDQLEIAKKMVERVVRDTPACFNDGYGRTHAEVLAALYAAAALAEES
jgi:hypothetical protein